MPTSQDTSPGDEGPLAHAARVASERSYLDELAGARVSAFERASGARPQRTPKRLLVSLSHSIEKAVLAGPIEYPTIVVALFQEMRFFDREREVYERMAAAGVVVVVGFVEDAGHTPPRGVHVVALRQGESLADEWSVVAVGPRAGAFLVATDQHAFDPSERDHEASREFVGRWGYSRAQAGTELARLRFSLGDRLDVVLRATIDDLLAEHMPAGGDPAASAGTPGETWATTSLGHVMDGMQTARAGTRELREQLLDAQRAAAARAASTTDPHSGVSNPDFLNRWSHSTGANPLPIGLALFDVAELDGPAMRADDRASYFAAHQVAAALTQPLGPVDAVVRMSAREFLVVVPGASDRHLAGLCDRIGEQLELASHGYPGISLRARVASVVTRNRPLPVGELHGSLVRLEDGSGPVDGGEITGGDRIVVSSTALHAAPDDRPRPDEDRASEHPSSDPESTDDVSTEDTSAREVPADDAPADHEPVEPASNGHTLQEPGPTPADAERSDGHETNGAAAAAAPPSPQPEVSPFGHTASRDADPPDRSRGSEGFPGSAYRLRELAPADRPSPSPGPVTPPPPSARPGGHRARPDPEPDDRADTGPDAWPPGSPGTEMHPELPQRTAQEALHRLVFGEESTPAGDPRARMDVFADLSDPPNGHGYNR